MSSRFAIAFVVVAALWAVPTAFAARAPTKSERAGIAKVARVPARCLKIRVSTVDSHYASAYRRNTVKSCARYQGDGVAVFRHRKSGWRFVTAGSAFECPVPHVPSRVAKDLDIRCY